MKLHRGHGITGKSAWLLGRRIRKEWNVAADRFSGAVKVNETYIGGKKSNKRASKKLKAGRSAVVKT